MRFPQVIIHEDDGALARALQPFVAERKWVLRELRRVDACLRALSRGRPSVLVLKAGRDVVNEMTFLERVHWLCPEVPALVVGEAEGSPLANLAWHLGASHVLSQAQAREQLIPVVAGLMEHVFEQHRTVSAGNVIPAPTASDRDEPLPRIEPDE